MHFGGSAHQQEVVTYVEKFEVSKVDQRSLQATMQAVN